MARTKKQVPIVAGLFTQTPEGPNLIGSRCVSCGAHYFPKSSTCNNPQCKDRRTEEVSLSRRGELWSYTIQYYPPPLPFRMDGQFQPYAIGLVELSEGIRVLGIMSTSSPETLKVGIKVEMVLEKLYTDENGNEVVTWKFRPL